MAIDGSRPEPFHHQRLDHRKSSIRLIKILPGLTANGMLRCEVTHTTTGSQIVYRCLSYQWGEPDAATLNQIELNGAPFTIRKNLYDFLQTLRSNIGYNTILGTWAEGIWWIDAMCIDQQHTLERNHQVALMGAIYSEAEEVVAWLGLASLAKNKARNLFNVAAGGASLPDRRTIGRRVVRNEYWNRAWITQEIILAQSVSILVDDFLCGFTELVNLLSTLDIPWQHSHFGQFVDIRNGTIDLSNHTLIDLLEHFQDRKCSIPRDRVFSLLSLSSDLSKSIRVDYDMPEDLLAYQILQACTGAGNSKYETCFCSATIVARGLGMAVSDESTEFPASGRARTHLEFEVANLDLAATPIILGRGMALSPLIIKLVYAGAVRKYSPAVSQTYSDATCHARGFARFKQLISDDQRLATFHSQRSVSEMLGVMTDGHAVELARIVASFIAASERPSPSKSMRFAPGCSIEVVDREANICLVRIAFGSLSEAFFDVTQQCREMHHSPAQEHHFRNLRLVHALPKSSV